MEAFASAVLSDLVSRLISSMIRRYSESQSREEKLQRLQQLLLRVRTIIEEAQGRDITNGGMLLQLKMLAEAMYRGHFVLDAFKYRDLAKKAAGDDDVRYSLALSEIKYPCKRPRSATSMGLGSETMNELKFVLGNLEGVIANVQEFVIFLGSYPRMFRQPYSTYLFVDTCMFGRQTETQRVINFLLQKEDHSTRNLSVFPIIGVPGVGKKTLVEHACCDERVLNYYSSIVHFNLDDPKISMLSNLKVELFPATRYLFVIEYGYDVDEAEWRMFYSSVSSMVSSESKIIIISKTDKVSSFGTTQPLALKQLSAEEYWYFFKVLVFGSSNADEHPRLASLAMSMATEFKGSFLIANVCSRLLRANFDEQFWCGVLASWRKFMQKNLHLLNETTMDLVAKEHPLYHQHQMGRTADEYLVCNYYSTGSHCIELPKVTSQDLITGNNIPDEEEFQILAWKSHLPPYHNYILSLVKQKPQGIISKKRAR